MLAELQPESVGLRLAEPVKVTLLVPVELLLWHTEAVKLALTVLQLDTLLDRLGVLLAQLLELPLMVCATEVAPGLTLTVELEQTEGAGEGGGERGAATADCTAALSQGARDGRALRG